METTTKLLFKNIFFNTNILYAFIFILSIVSINAYGQATWINQTYNPNVAGIEQNPMKGLFPGINLGVSSNFPYSIVHVYLPLKPYYKNFGEYDWAAFEAEINKVTSRGCHAIPRFYLDYPGKEYAMPTFLQSLVPASSYSAQGNSTSKLPDYNNETLMKALEDFIAALGSKYDNDPRFMMFEAGLYGFWGEWHNSGVSGKDMTQANKDRIITAYANAFKYTHVALRHAGHPGTDALARKVGYYDDSYFYQTLCNSGVWCFMYGFRSRNLTDVYKTHPIGGEVYPDTQTKIFKAWPNTDGENITNCINESHNSFVRVGYLFKQQPSQVEYDNGIKTAKLMGYTFYVSSVQILPISPTSYTVNLNIQNKGVAPIYYNWQAEIAAIKKSGEVSGVVKTVDWNTNLIQSDGKDYLKTVTADLPDTGTYKILMRFKNPLESLTKNAKVLRFANSQQDADKAGWLTLGTVTLGEFTHLISPKTQENFIRIYPNPVSDILNIDFNNAEMSREIKIFNTLGQLIYSVQTKDSKTKINLQALNTKGIVMVQVIDGKTVTNHRVLVK